jgi:hypothetical protein
MAKSLHSRLDAIEAALVRREQRRYRRMFTVIAAEYGFGPEEVDDLMQDCEAFFAQPLAQQLTEVDALKAELGEAFDDYEAIRATLIREYRGRGSCTAPTPWTASTEAPDAM